MPSIRAPRSSGIRTPADSIARGFPTRTAWDIDRGRRSQAGLRQETLGRRNLDSQLPRMLDQQPGDRVLGMLLDGRRQPQRGRLA